MELWKQIDNTNYEVSNHGNIRNITTGRIKKISVDRYGYASVRLWNLEKHKKTPYKVHRLVANAFVPNQNNYPQVNHKDEDKLNNVSANLEWCTSRYNINYGTRNRRVAIIKSTPIVGTNIETGEQIYFESAKEAGRNGFNFSHIRACIRGIRNKHGGYKWSALPAEI